MRVVQIQDQNHEVTNEHHRDASLGLRAVDSSTQALQESSATVATANSGIDKPNGHDGYATCSNPSCKQPHKLQSEFYFKKTESRYESICKHCKKSNAGARKRSRRLPNQESNDPLVKRSSTPRPKRLIERKPKVDKTADDQTDYSLWEKMYGRPLTDAERIEIKISLSAFFKVLIEHR